MKEVKISFNNQTWASDGTFYQGRFSLSHELFNEFKTYVEDFIMHLSSSETTIETIMDITYLKHLDLKRDIHLGHYCLYMTFRQKCKLIEFLRLKGIAFEEKRTLGQFNYYIEVRH